MVEPVSNQEQAAVAASSTADVEASTEETRAPSEDRVIVINGTQPVGTTFANNRISTAKYTAIGFLPVFLYEQFQKWSNIFFLITILLQQVPDASPLGRYTTLLPFIFLLSVSAIKEIIEDIKRHRADDEMNDRTTDVLRESNWSPVRWADVVVGDIVKVQNQNFIPADLVLLSSSEPQGISYIETSNLDGETNLKIRQALKSTSAMITVQDLLTLSGTVECEQPNNHLYEFKGMLKPVDKPPEPLGPDQVLLRGAKLRNTCWVFGIVIYTGKETKLMKNSTKKAPLKRSNVDKLSNIQILFLAGIILFMCLVCSIFNIVWSKKHVGHERYIDLGDSDTKSFFSDFLTFFILFNTLVPISLQVTLEGVRFIQIIFINADIEMYHVESNTPAMARTSNLNEALGQVKYIFSDKTGTLTRNIMELKKCAVGNDIYSFSDNTDGALIIQHLQYGRRNAELIRELLVLLSVCHTVIPEIMPDGSIEYNAASSDERALVCGAKKVGYLFQSRTPDYVEINALGKIERYEILAVLEFTSARQRMSVIVRDPKGKIKLYCKGADNVIYERLNPELEGEHNDIILQHLEDFASEGLRTLCCATTELTELGYEKWKQIYLDATKIRSNREEHIAEAADLIERNLTLIGATAIEDKLQEGVPETIDTLLKADINIWVLTGDKQETAINIGYSCKLLSHEMDHIILNQDDLAGTEESILEYCRNLGFALGEQNDIFLVIDGKTLKYALSRDLREHFLKLCLSCAVVICCRVSPLQKAEVVEYVTKHTKTVTLAIGDGANDVAMIQKAHVGVGISGAEGLHAACASDYSIGQFRFLLRLLLVHGSWNYSRMYKVILYSFYKNICLYLIGFWFAIYSGWSGQILFERWSISLYNVLFTALPPLAIGLFDKTCSAKNILNYPALYKLSQSGVLFNHKVFWLWVVNSVFHSALLFWLPVWVFQIDNVWMNGKQGGYLSLGMTVYTCIVVTVCLKAGLITTSWIWITHWSIWGSIALWFIFAIIYSFFWPTFDLGCVMTRMYKIIMTSSVFWLCSVLVPVITILPDVIFEVIRCTVFKTLMDVIRESEDTNTEPEIRAVGSSNVLRSTASKLKRLWHRRSRRVRNVSVSSRGIRTDMRLSRGFAFSHVERGVFSQTQVIRAYNSNKPKPAGI